MNEELQCHFCQRQFARREHLARHVQTHTNDKPFECSTCHMTFARIDALSRHFNTRHADKGPNSSANLPAQKVQVACNPCGKARVRCTGTNPCQRCATMGLDCQYNPHRRAAREKKRLQQQQLQQQQQQQENLQSDASVPTEGSAHLGSLSYASDASASQYTHGQLATNQRLEFGTEFGSLQTPSSLANSDPLIQTHQHLNIMGDYNDLTDFVFTDFDSVLGDTMPPLSGIEWAMLDLPIDPQGMMLNINSSGDNTDFLQRAELRQSMESLSDAEIEPRKFKMTTISRDAPLVFPDMTGFHPGALDEEDTAHVDVVEDASFQPLLEMAAHLQGNPFHPPFQRLVFPPAPVMNVFIQLYFENFHPILPILHKPTFSPKTTHWLLLFTVASIGSRYSKIANAQECSLAMCELVRRLSAYMCESENKRSRDVWMIQVVLLANVAMMYCGDPRMMELAELKQSLPVSMGRRKRIFDESAHADALSNPELSIYQRWRMWISFEERRRLAFATWIIDSNHGIFLNLTTLMTLDELRCSIPCAEEIWESPTAQVWSSHLDTQTKTMKALFATNSLMYNWSSLGYLGRQAAIHHVFRTCQDFNQLVSHSSEFSATVVTQREKLLRLLDDIYAQESQIGMELGGWNSSTSVSIRLLIHLARIVLHAPFPELPNWVFRQVSGVSWQDDAHCTRRWMIQFPQDCRHAILHAGQACALIRDTNPQGFTDSVVLLYSTFILWAFTESSVVDMQFPTKSPLLTAPASSQSLSASGNALQTFFLDGNCSPSEIQYFLLHGAAFTKIRGVGTITTQTGRLRLLETLTALMGSRNVWGISKVYRRILVRLMTLSDETGQGNKATYGESEQTQQRVDPTVS